jgi:hypothetical protein
VRTALTGRTVLLPTDDVEAYQKHVARFDAQFKPVTDREKELTQNIADTQWRLNRIFALEQGIYAVGRLDPREIGFDFSTADLLAYHEAANRRQHVSQGVYYSKRTETPPKLHYIHHA